MTPFATGFFPEINTIDFDFVFAAASFQNNVTIYLFLIICFTTYLLFMIWAFIRDKKDARLVMSPFMVDNHPEDTYMYEILVETGPLASHATTAEINFVLFGEEDETEVRCFNDPER